MTSAAVGLAHLAGDPLPAVAGHPFCEWIVEKER
jgi:hypothetical protein